MPDRAPGPGRSIAESASVINVGGMQKMLTSFAGFAGPSVAKGPAGAPVSTIVRARSMSVKAPGVRCPQLLKPVTDAQDVLDAQGTGRHGPPPHAGHDVPMRHVQAAPLAEPLHLRANVLRALFLQNPQNTPG